jgi:tRNA threonylcarbamoyladenosine biosynthesis protein TsaE
MDKFSYQFDDIKEVSNKVLVFLKEKIGSRGEGGDGAGGGNLSDQSQKVTYKIASEKALVVGLIGDLGTGKTTLTKYICELLGVESVVNSPTFVIQKKYKTKDDVFKEVVHIDAYRLDDPKEIAALKFEEVFATPGALVIVEWPEKLEGVMPSDTVYLKISHADGREGRFVEGV